MSNESIFYSMHLGASHTMLHACPEVTQGRGMDGFKPITVREIHEAVRRHAMGYNKPIGNYNHIIDRGNVIPYLAI